MKFRVFNNNNNEFRHDCLYINRNGTTVSHITIPNLKKALREIMSANEILRL